MANREVLREFLVGLGFQIDEGGARRFMTQLTGISKLSAGVGASIAGVAVSAEAMVQVFASGMEKLYYASMRTKTSVANIQALRFAAEQVGVSAEEATGALESMSRAVRLNPGLGQLLKGMGVDPASQTKLTDFLHKLAQMPDFVAAQYGQMFGIDSDTLFMLIKQLPALEEAQAKYLQRQKEAGINADEAAKASKEYSNQLRELWTQLGLIKDRLSIEMLPAFKTFTGALSEVMTDIVQGRSDIVDWGTAWDTVKAVFWALGKAVSYAAGEIRAYKAALDSLKNGTFIKDYTDKAKKATWGEILLGTTLYRQIYGEDPESKGLNEQLEKEKPKAPGQTSGGKIGGLGARGSPQAAAGGKPTAAELKAYANQMARQYSIPPEIFSSLIQKESGWDPSAIGDGGAAIGLTQLHGPAAQEAGVNRSDPYENIKGGAWYLAQRYKQHGNWRDALAAYNQGDGGQAKGLGYGYADSVLGGARGGAPAAGKGGDTNVNVQTNITVSGSGDPKAVADEVVRSNDRAVRNALRYGLSAQG